jgi:hypothetical protein
LGIHANDEEVNSLLTDLDKNKDGQVTYAGKNVVFFVVLMKYFKKNLILFIEFAKVVGSKYYAKKSKDSILNEFKKLVLKK